MFRLCFCVLLFMKLRRTLKAFALPRPTDLSLALLALGLAIVFKAGNTCLSQAVHKLF